MDDRDSRGADGGRPGGLGRVVPPDAQSSDEYARWANKDRHPRDVDADADKDGPATGGVVNADIRPIGEGNGDCLVSIPFPLSKRTPYKADTSKFGLTYADAVRDRNRGSS
jgi:hypothetical protein